ncbi:hypothetical protein IWQ47_001789 [Aquimarina sp. EL_43]|uniref:hypothetical protein n=1 Tax=Aquimarina TaxID=290174 RepID=UPI00046FD3ED|nr:MULTISPECIES: hypothetical protein [Aquimarina]MBG6130128.1 hypothetical protein [Aquimarina sp. EL_35]MBG6148908.1 hypothetical protein [Aquimarina sp. EL_32]MBG6168718.1 hypothetical protein [Aquimarina sp. EL_43]
MKNVAIIIILFQSFQGIHAQKVFADTQEFLVTTEIMDRGEKHPSYVINLVRSGEENLDIISTLTIEDTELFEDIFITALENPGLEGVSKVIKMEVEYLACCAHVEAYYYMLKEDNTIVALPELKNVYCENSDNDFQYIFPNQEYGIKDNILQTQTFYQTTTTNTKYVNLKQSFTWKDGIVGDSKTTAITGY